MKKLLSLILGGLWLGLFLGSIATVNAQVANPQWKINTPSSTITPVNSSLKVPCANIVGGCGASTSTSGNFTIGGVNSSTIYGDGSSTFFPVVNTRAALPSPTQLAAGARCGNTYPVYDAGACINAIYTAAPSSTEIDLGSYRWNYSTPAIANISGKYIYLKGVPGGGSYLSFTPTYATIVSASTSTKQITYTSSSTLFTGEAVTVVANDTGTSTPSGLTTGTLYYVGNLTSSTLILYKNAALTTTSTINGTGVGTLETPAGTFDIGNSKHEGWGVDGIYLKGPGTGSSTGWYYGGTQGAEGFTIQNSHETGFYHNIYQGDNAYFTLISNNISDFNAPNNDGGGLMWMNAISNAGEQERVINSTFADAQPANGTTAENYAVWLQTSGALDHEWSKVSIDDAGVHFDVYDGQANIFNCNQCHVENPGAAGGGWTAYVPFSTNAGNPNTSVAVTWNGDFLNDGVGANAFTNMMQIGPGVKVTLSGVTATANLYTGATTVPDFMTLSGNSTVSVQGFANLGDTPGVTYIYGSRAASNTNITNGPSFYDGATNFAANATFYNGTFLNPVVSTVSSTLANYSPTLQVCNSTSSITYTMPTIANDTGELAMFTNRGTANCVLQATSTDLFSVNNVTSTSYTIIPGGAISLVDDATYWTVTSNANYGVSVGNVTMNATSTSLAGNVPFITTSGSSTISSTSTLSITGSGVNVTGTISGTGSINSLNVGFITAGSGASTLFGRSWTITSGNDGWIIAHAGNGIAVSSTWTSVGTTTAGVNTLDVFGSADVRNNLAVGTTTTSTTLELNDSTNNSSTLRIGGGTSRFGCVEMNDSVNSSTLEYIYTVSGALTATTTKPTFCQ